MPFSGAPLDRYQGPTTQQQKSMYLSCEQVPSQAVVECHLQAFVLKLMGENPMLAVHEATFGAVIDRFIEEERLLEIKKVTDPGRERDPFAGAKEGRILPS